MFQITKQTLILDKDNVSQYNMQFLNDDFICLRKKAIQIYLAPSEKVIAPQTE